MNMDWVPLMQQNTTGSILTGNDLLSGEVVFLTAERTFSPNIRQSFLFVDEQQASAELEKTLERVEEVVAPYLIAVNVDEADVRPSHVREHIRVTGPSNYFHGKQADIG